MKRAFLNRTSSLIINISRFSLQKTNSLSSRSSSNPNFSTSKNGGGSEVYRRVLQNQRPNTIRWNRKLNNSVKFIGRIDRPLEVYNTKGESFGAYTFIQVTNHNDPNRTFRMLVEMWGDLAKSSIQHLKQNDNIHVSGCLAFYKDDNGNVRSNYKVIANDLCYVAESSRRPTFGEPEESESESKISKRLEESEPEGEIGIESYKTQLYLWELFFSKPYEWWDKRKSKRDSKSPDFKHKFNAANLWLRPDDPPWVKRQLQLLDMEIAQQRQAHAIGQTGVERYNNRHHLWQVFFSNPHEWWDNRKDKKSSRSPDFKHKDTGEALWIKLDDPPWVKRQLQVLNTKMEEHQTGVDIDSGSKLSKWVFDD